MKKALILSLIAFSSAVANAQVSAKDSIAAAKAAAKAAKAKQAQELKEFIETQKNGKVVTISVPDLVTPDDSVAYIYGIATSRGLKQHVLNNLKVDSTYLNLFAEGVLNRVNTDDSDQKTHAINKPVVPLSLLSFSFYKNQQQTILSSEKTQCKTLISAFITTFATFINSTQLLR